MEVSGTAVKKLVWDMVIPVKFRQVSFYISGKILKLLAAMTVDMPVKGS